MVMIYLLRTLKCPKSSWPVMKNQHCLIHRNTGGCYQLWRIRPFIIIMVCIRHTSVHYSLSGQVFTWGRYTNVYVAEDADGLKAVCRFDIYVRSKWTLKILILFYFSLWHLFTFLTVTGNTFFLEKFICMDN